MTVPIAGRNAAAVHRGWINRAECRGRRSMTEKIRAEMVANVWKIVVAEGDVVSDGDTLVILESMKMEIPVLSEVTGTVAKLAVSEGDVVQQGDLIAVLNDVALE
jgi:acetyl-CoA carboxylase biotin carboxyl carrier protein